jgi:hypothetical protein
MRVSSSAAVRSNAGIVSSSLPRLARGIGNAPMDQLGCAGELGADLAHAIAEAYHVSVSTDATADLADSVPRPESAWNRAKQIMRGQLHGTDFAVFG